MVRQIGVLAYGHAPLSMGLLMQVIIGFPVHTFLRKTTNLCLSLESIVVCSKNTLTCEGLEPWISHLGSVDITTSP